MNQVLLDRSLCSTFGVLQRLGVDPSMSGGVGNCDKPALLWEETELNETLVGGEGRG